jgi:CPA2 family monovalent cation:H+ antiporter-2
MRMHTVPLLDIIMLLASAVLIVTVFRALRLSPVLGYLMAGVLIGPYGLKWVNDVADTSGVAELGVLLLLFMIGLELSWDRLKAMRFKVFGIGSVQVTVTGAVLTLLAIQIGLTYEIAVLVGFGLALSSTALVLQVLEERRESASQTGRLSLAILILQDIAAMPLLVMVPLLAVKNTPFLEGLGGTALKAFFALVAIMIFGRFILRPLFRTIAKLAIHELFVATTLLVVLGIAWLAQENGLSMALGAFLAGILISETEFRHQVEADIKPYKGLLMGLFFMTVGMHIDIDFIVKHAQAVLVLAIGLLLVKGALLYVILRLFNYGRRTAGHTALILAQGGEFGFILFGLAAQFGVLPEGQSQLLLLVITVTMALTPLLDMLGGRLEREWRKRARTDAVPEIEEECRDLKDHVVIAGYGRMGGILADVLTSESVPFIAMDINPRHVSRGRRRHHPVYYGDAGRADVLEAIGTTRARAIILTFHNVQTTEKALCALRAVYPEMAIFARAKDEGEAERLLEAGATGVVPEVYVGAMKLISRLFTELDWPEGDIHRVMEAMRTHKRNVIMSTN